MNGRRDTLIALAALRHAPFAAAGLQPAKITRIGYPAVALAIAGSMVDGSRFAA